MLNWEGVKRAGRRIRLTGHPISDRLRMEMLHLGVTMSEVARMLGVDRWDVSHALSPRAKRKRYVKLRQRIRQLLRRLKSRRPRWGWEAAERMGYRSYCEYQALIAETLDAAVRLGEVLPPISVWWCAMSWMGNPSTYLKALRGDPKISEATRQRVWANFVQYLRETWEQWVKAPMPRCLARRSPY